jgi:hypothetical protein
MRQDKANGLKAQIKSEKEDESPLLLFRRKRKEGWRAALGWSTNKNQKILKWVYISMA